MLFDVRGERLRSTPQEVKEGFVSSVAFGRRADRRGISAACVVLFDARGERLRPAPLEVKEGEVTSVAFGPEGKIAAGHLGGAGVVLFDARGERLRSTPLEVKEGVSRAWPSGPRARSPPDMAASAAAAWCSSMPGASGSDRVAAGQGGRCLERGLRPEDRIAAGYGGGGGVVLFDARGERLRTAPLQVKEGDVRSVTFGPEGKIAADISHVGDGDGVVLFDAGASGSTGHWVRGLCRERGLRPGSQDRRGISRLRRRRGGALRCPGRAAPTRRWGSRRAVSASVVFGPEGKIAAEYRVRGGGGVVLQCPQRAAPNRAAGGQGGRCQQRGFRAEGRIAAVSRSRRRRRRGAFRRRGERLRAAPLEVKEGEVTSVAFGPEGEIAAGYGVGRFGVRGGVVLFDARGDRL